MWKPSKHTLSISLGILFISKSLSATWKGSSFIFFATSGWRVHPLLLQRSRQTVPQLRSKPQTDRPVSMVKIGCNSLASVIVYTTEILRWLRCSRVANSQCNCPGFDPSILRHSGIWGAADEAVLNTSVSIINFSWGRTYGQFDELLNVPYVRSKSVYDRYGRLYRKTVCPWIPLLYSNSGGDRAPSSRPAGELSYVWQILQKYSAKQAPYVYR